ncbi:DNA replication protein [Azospirillum sp. RWY-5-1]|uniref:DNA replication protein n=1 Tax=Azospirillum oleiclasticum TaxID=2735135 RepID=A0ABX2T244_9PROT|nr:DnaA/Hda family protein [Azospirillum oleiclasticum]NYZ11213.1 DNA replication protein [Azospirillum oleiclasticum]NYZ18374.1 DNA replication protein [Azospirillum oleiclasticum]
MSLPAQLPLDLGHRPASGRDDFLVAPSNAEAIAWLDAWPAWPAPALTLFGPAGCGKTHLAHVWRARSHATLVSGEDLDRADLPGLLGNARAVAVDDADRVAGRRAREEALFHLYNLARDAGGHLLLLSGRPPSRWRMRLADLRSRVKAAPAVGVEAPDDALLAAVLVKLFADRQLRPGLDVITYLLARMERSLDAAGRIVAATDRLSLAARRAITVPLVREVLADLDRT